MSYHMLVVTLKRICVLEYLNRNEREKQCLYKLDKKRNYTSNILPSNGSDKGINQYRGGL
jgi:hypothetical protein